LGAGTSTSALARLPATYRGARWLLLFGIWTAVGLFDLTQQMFDSLTTSGAGLSWRAVLLDLVDAWLWVGLTPFIFWLCEVFPIDRATWRRHVGVHALAIVAFAAIEIGILALSWLHPPRLHAAPLFSRFLEQLLIDVFSYSGVAGAAHAMAYYQLYVERRLRAAELETQLGKARLQALAAQLQPHFLFNTLHSIASLVRSERNADAVKMVAGLGDLLRAALRHDGVQEVPVREEMEFVERYLDLQQIRFRDRLQVEIDVDPVAEDALVPFLILQPIVENALRHGIETGEGPARVAIRVGVDGETLSVRVHNRDERRDAAPSGDGNGIGLLNTRARLSGLYRELGGLELTREAPGGALIRLTLPLHRTPWEAGA